MACGDPGKEILDAEVIAGQLGLLPELVVLSCEAAPSIDAAGCPAAGCPADA